MVNLNLKRSFSPLPKYPSVTRDAAFKVNENINAQQVEEEIRRAGGKLVRKVELFDVYRGSQIKNDEKSLAFALEFLSEDHTLKQEEVDHIMESIVKNISNKLGGSLRD